MNFLTLVNRFLIDYSVAGAHRGYTTLAGAPQRIQLTMRHINRAYQEICNEWLDWTFLTAEFDTIIDGNVDSIQGRADVDHYNTNAFYGRDTGGVRKQINYIDWTLFRHMRAATRYVAIDSMPECMSIDTSGKLHFYPPSKNAFVLNATAKLKYVEMVDDTDEPLIPDTYQNAILYKAAVHHFEYEDAVNERQGANVHYSEALTKLEGGCLPHGSSNVISSEEAPHVMVTE